MHEAVPVPPTIHGLSAALCSFLHPHSRSATVLSYELDAGLLKGTTQLRNCPLLGCQYPRLRFKSLYAGQRYARGLSQIPLLPPKERTGSPNLFACDRQFNTSGIDIDRAML